MMTTDGDHVAERLRRRRPVPRAAFRGLLRRHLRAIGSPPARPQRLAALVMTFASAGALLLIAGVVSVMGFGPLAS